MLSPSFGEADEAGGGGDAAHSCDLAVGDVERHGAYDLVAEEEEDGGGAVDERVVDGGRAAGESPFRRCGLETGSCDGGDALRSVLLQQRCGQAGTIGVGDRDCVVGEQCHQPFNTARGGSGEEFCDDAAGGCRVDLVAAAARGGDAVPGPVEVLLACGLGDVEDLGDLGMAVGERFAQEADGPFEERTGAP
ncbi:hypothetical protein ADL04_01490 [Streptomyces sp. NRRL B-3648]|nr:hypothetical protein ADL04_01490 [Streptomyces sp. NRRL B-3648]